MEAIAQKLVVKTSMLQEMVARAYKACGMIDSLPITGMLQLKCENNTLQITATDNVNMLIISRNEVEGNLYAMVDATLFNSLIGKLTTPLTTITVENDILTVSANGKYEFKVIKEEDGSNISIKIPDFNTDVQSNHVDNNVIRSILTMNKSCKADMKEMPALINYYMDENRVLTSDLYRICNNPVKLFNEPVCITPQLAEMIPLVADDKGVDIKANEQLVMFSSSFGTLIGRKALQEDLESFPVNELTEVLQNSMSNSCVINRTLLTNAIDRICLFSNELTNKSVNLTFEVDQLTLTTGQSNNKESIKYLTDAKISNVVTYCVDGNFLKTQLNGSPREDITIKFGTQEDTCIQIISDNVVETLGFCDEEEV